MMPHKKSMIYYFQDYIVFNLNMNLMRISIFFGFLISLLILNIYLTKNVSALSNAVTNETDGQISGNLLDTLNSSQGITVAAMIAAISSIIGVFLTGLIGYLNQEKLAKIQALNQEHLALLQEKIDNRMQIENARREYEFEARKRLYQQCEPILFQLYELSDSALNRLEDLAEQIREGKFRSNSETSSDDSYSIQSTIFRLLSPLAAFVLLQKKLTLVDLRLDNTLTIQYTLIKRLYFTFAADEKIAKKSPSLEYDPYGNTSDENRKRHPEKYIVQGIKAGMIDKMTKTFIECDHTGNYRLIDFGEFQQLYSQNENALFSDIRSLFLNFHPNSSPVLWRILLVQALIYKAFMTTFNTSSMEEERSKMFQMYSQEIKQRFDWRTQDERSMIQSADVLDKPFIAAESYLKEYFGNYF